MNLGTHLPFFLAGICCFRIWQRIGFARHPAGWTLLAGSIGLAVLLEDNRVQGILSAAISAHCPQIAWSLVFAMLILACCISPNPILVRGPLRELGKLSFSVYLIHPILMASMIAIDFAGRIDALVHSVYLGLLVGVPSTVALVCTISYLTFKFVELPGIELGRRTVMRYRGGQSVGTEQSVLLR